MNNSLIHKYNVAGPRYTSYPTVPYWDMQTFSLKKWKHSLIQSFKESNSSEGLSLYVHLPFCESLCTFCGCNKRITKRHDVEASYISFLLKEWQLYLDLFDERPKIKELHIGGGTPTFFSPENLQSLVHGLLQNTTLADHYEFSFEGHPNNTTFEHLQTFYNLGFRRVSFGVQDYNDTVQKAIHRVQPFENVKKVTEQAREIGYTSIGHDLIYGLPFQTAEHIQQTIIKTESLMPDRIAFYSYAHVPWMKGNGQRGFQSHDLPSADLKLEHYKVGKKMLTHLGYKDIGMDHFALPTDTLYAASKGHQLHRNFMGYSASKTQVMIGLGVSAISDSWYGFSQNVKGIEEYEHLVSEAILPVFRGHILSSEDLLMRTHILNLMCNFETEWNQEEFDFDTRLEVVSRLREMEADELVEITNSSIKVTDKGKPFIRNVCMAFDMKLHRHKPKTQLFSMTI